MRDFSHLSQHFKRYGRSHEALYILAIMLFFWTIFDGITTYITPLVLIEQGVSKTVMGLIISSSSVFGALFDFLMCKVFKNSYYRRIFLTMFSISLVYLLVLAAAKTVWMFLLAMFLWGIYYDLKNFGSFNFVARFTQKSEHTSSFGVLTVFEASGFLVAPIIAGMLIQDKIGVKPFIAAGLFLVLALAGLLILFKQEKNYHQEKIAAQYRYRGLIFELQLWRRLDKVLFPALVMIMVLNIVDAFFWTIGPLLAESFVSLHQLAGLFMAAYILPSLLTGWLVGSVTKRFGKKKTAYFSLLGASLFLIGLGYFQEPLQMIIVVLLASTCISFSWPAIRSAFADYIQEAGKYEKEIEGLEDLFTNLGYVIGPAAAGILADNFGNNWSFAILGVFGVLVALYLLKTSPKKINVLKSLGGPK